MVRALALALLPFLADAAYDCATFPGYKLTGNASTTYCGGLYACSLNDCCVDDATKCGNPSTVVVGGCWNHTGKTYTPGATGTTPAECCVVDLAKCSSMTCDASMGLKARTSQADSYCASATCSADHDLATCCEADNTTCYYFGMVPGCGTGKSVPTSKYGTTGSTVAACCEDDTTTTTTTTTTAKCSTDACTYEFTFTGVTGKFYEPDTTKANVDFSSADSDEVKTQKCCKVKTTLCEANKASITCATGKTNKGTNVGSTAAACCVDDHTCSTYVPAPPPPSDNVLGGTASSASGLEWAPVLFVTNIFALSRLF